LVAEFYDWPNGGGPPDPVGIYYGYDSNGLPGLVLYPSGAEVGYSYGTEDPSDGRRLSQITYDGTPIVSDIKYFPLGPVKSYALESDQCGSSKVPVKTTRDDGRFMTSKYADVTKKLHSQTFGPDTTPILKSSSVSSTACSTSTDCQDGDTCDTQNGKCSSSLHDSNYHYDWLHRVTCDETTSTSNCPASGGTRSKVTYQSGNTRIASLYYTNRFTSSETLTYSYDSGTNQVVSLGRSQAGRTVSIAYNSRGRRVFDSEDSLPPLSGNDTWANRSFGYHLNGRLAVTFGHQPYQEEVSQGVYSKSFQPYEASYTYDHKGRRISKTVFSPVGSHVWFYFYDKDDRLITELHYPDDPQQEASVYDYVYLGKTMVYQSRSTATGELNVFYVSNQRGQPVVGFEEQTCNVVYRADVDLFGWTTAREDDTIHQPFRSLGKYEDQETQAAYFDPSTFSSTGSESDVFVFKPGLYYNWHRYYDPLTGYYISPDPSGLRHDRNPYRHVLNSNPNYVDDDGFRIPWGKNLGGTGVGGIAGVDVMPGVGGWDALIGALIQAGIVTSAAVVAWLLEKLARPEDLADTDTIPLVPGEEEICPFDFLNPTAKRCTQSGPYRGHIQDPTGETCLDSECYCKYRCLSDGMECSGVFLNECPPAVLKSKCALMSVQ